MKQYLNIFKNSIDQNFSEKEFVLEQIAHSEFENLIETLELDIAAGYKLSIVDRKSIIKEALEWNKEKEINEVENQIHNLQQKLKKLKS